MKKVICFLISLNTLGVHAQIDTIRQLSEIVVEATRADHRTPTAYTNLRALDAAQSAVMPEVPAAIALSPSVVMTSENGAGIGNQSFRIRGSDATRTNVTFDGVPINDAESQAVYWVNMPDLTSSLQTMQIQRGVGTSTNGGSAFGATLNMQSAQPAIDPYGQASVAYGSFNTFKINAAVGTGRSPRGWSADMRYSLGRTDGYIDHTGSRQQSLFFTGGYSSSQRIVKMNIFLGDQHTDISWTGVPENELDKNRRYNPEGLYTDDAGNTLRYDNHTDNYRQAHIHLIYTEQLSERIKLNATLYYTRGKGYYEEYEEDEALGEYYPDPDLADAETDLTRRKYLDNHLLGAIATASYTSGKTRAYLGMSGSYFGNNHYGDVLWAANPALIPGGRERWYRNTAKKPDMNAFLKIIHQIGNRLYAFGDIQWRYIEHRMDGHDDDLQNIAQRHYYRFFNPKAGVTYAVTSQQRAYASFAVGRREPSRADIKDAMKGDGTEKPRPETLYDAEAGYEYSGSTWSAGANLFYMYYIDQLVSTGRMNDVGYVLMENVPESFRAGIELSIGTHPVKGLQINANLAYSRNKIRDYTAYIDASSGNPDWNTLPQRIEHHGTTDIAYSPDWVGAAELQYEIVKGLTAGLTAKYVGAQYYDNTSSADRRLDGYFINNAVAQYRREFGRCHAAIQLVVNNLWNANYFSNALVYRWDEGTNRIIDRYFFPQPFRNYMLKLTVGF